MKRFLLVLAVAIPLAGTTALSAGGGKSSVLPASATPADYTLDDMAAVLADFDTSGNDTSYLPTDIPFRILYTRPGDTFEVPSGTMFFVPVFSIDDSPTIIGDFPTREEEIPGYVFGYDQFGAHDVAIVVDGQATPIGPEYLGSAYVPAGLLDGDGTHLIQLGAFVAPLSVGTHTVTIQATFEGEAFVDFFGGPFSFEISYTVIVEP
jgi:hypothetical protein